MVIKKKLQLNYTEAIYLFAGNTLLQANQTLFDVYEKYAAEDLFLHLNYCEYSTFGATEHRETEQMATEESREWINDQYMVWAY